MPSVSFSRSRGEWTVLGDRRRGGPNGELVLTREELSELPATELRQALVKSAQYFDAEDGQATVSSVPEAYFDEDGPIEPVDFHWQGRGLFMKCVHLAPWPEDDNVERAAEELRNLLRPFLQENRASLSKLEVDDWLCAPPDIGFELQIDVSSRGRSMSDLFDIGQGALRLCEAFASPSLSRTTVGDLVRGGGASLLVGQPEGNWLDVKSQEYDLSTLHGQISLTQAVARFCNGEDGGLIVIGADAKKVPGGEIIRAVKGVHVKLGTAARYQRVLDRTLYPPALGLRIDIVEASADRSLIVIDVPIQPEELRPFLVHGAIRADGRTEGAFISIVQRRGEESIPLTAPMIHATLAAGRALLRGAPRASNGGSP
jgi:hypothetical protein